MDKYRGPDQPEKEGEPLEVAASFVIETVANERETGAYYHTVGQIEGITINIPEGKIPADKSVEIQFTTAEGKVGFHLELAKLRGGEHPPLVTVEYNGYSQDLTAIYSQGFEGMLNAADVIYVDPDMDDPRFDDIRKAVKEGFDKYFRDKGSNAYFLEQIDFTDPTQEQIHQTDTVGTERPERDE